MTDTQTTVLEVRKWSSNQDRDVRAAVELLIDQGHWLSSKDFVKKCTRLDTYSGARWVDWSDVSECIGRHELIGSSGEIAVLMLAALIARDTLRLSSLDTRNRDLAARAFTDALTR